MSRHPFRMDLRPFLPADWKEQIEAAVLDTALHIEGDRAGSSLSYDEAKSGLDFSTSIRSDLYEKLPWVKALYEDLVPVLLGQMGYGGREGDPRLRGQDPILCIDDEHAVSANVLFPGSKKKGLEWHRDGADVRLALIMTLDDWTVETGGRLFAWIGGEVRPLDYTAGYFWVVEASEIPHAVEELRVEKQRICLMFNYTNPEQKDWREPGESDYIYGLNARDKA